MISKSILNNLTNFTITDRSENEASGTQKGSNPTTSLLSNTTACGNDPRSQEDIIIIDDNGNMNHSNKKLKTSRDNATVTSKDCDLTVTTNETTVVQKSKVWQYATRCLNSNFAICLLCSNNKKISTNNGSTSTLRRHLISHHQMHELILPGDKRKRISSSIKDEESQHLHELFIKCIVRDGRTFNDLQKVGMKNVLQQIIPGYEPPTRYSVVRRLKHLYKFHYKKLSDDLALINDISITLDLWSNRQMRSFLVITGHYFSTDNFELKSTILNFSTFNTHHKAVDIRQVLEMRLKELNILNKVIRVTSDGGRNVVRAIHDLHSNIERVWCIAHRLHLCVTNGFGFWKVKKVDNGNNATALQQDNLNIISNDQQNGNKDVENLNNDSDTDELDEFNEVNQDFLTDESDNDESQEQYDSNGEEILSNDSNEEIEDNWTSDIVYSDSNIGYEQELITGVLKKCRALVSMVKRSTIITLYFDTERKKKNFKRNLCNDIKSRWNSTYVMLDSFIVLREVIQTLFYFKHHLKINAKQVKKLSSYELSGDDWNTLTALHYVLKPFYHATRVMSGREYPSIGLAFYLLIHLKSFLQNHEKKENLLVKKFKQLLFKQYVQYFENDYEQMELLKFHSYFDPAGFSALTDSEKRSIEHNVKKMLLDKIVNIPTSTIETSSISTTATTTIDSLNKSNPTEHSKSAMDLFNDSIGEISFEGNQRDKQQKAIIVEELHNYRKHTGHFNLNHKPDATSAIKFWKIYGDALPNLKTLAARMLSTPATSVPSESAFSVSSFLGRKERAALSGDNLSLCVFLKDKISF
ncbi:unnamed protein product [Adineta steineri]|uniref:BED-type domain-containing protein n=1 Tax=Adineta steineri TaxID=433720 RepID=A0A819XT99_9BILA|nr:unnamed protein product [Adineta steineri]CAF4140141.1 unnamed protein product [Adineta steineri]